MNIAENVERIFSDCLFRDNEISDGKPPADAVLVEGIVSKYGFHPERLAAHKAEIAEVIRRMPNEFMADSHAGGHSFLNLCMDKDGNQWGEHHNMEQLVTLAIATKQGQYLLPREIWRALPGGVPYLSFTPQSAADEGAFSNG